MKKKILIAASAIFMLVGGLFLTNQKSTAMCFNLPTVNNGDCDGMQINGKCTPISSSCIQNCYTGTIEGPSQPGL